MIKSETPVPAGPSHKTVNWRFGAVPVGCCSGKPLLGEVEILISDVSPQYLDDIRAGRWGA